PAGIGEMRADVTKVRQTLFNLLSNACKFTESGTITLNVSEGPGLLRFSVADTGIGMSEEQLAKLFQAFSQADASTTRKYGGTGLGLAISRKFCQMMGGDLTVTSEVGKGSTFSFTLPTNVPDAAPEATLAAPSVSSATVLQSGPLMLTIVDDKNIGFSLGAAEYFTKPIDWMRFGEVLAKYHKPSDGDTALVVEDDERTRELLRRTLEKEGWNVTEAANGRIALDRLN